MSKERDESTLFADEERDLLRSVLDQLIPPSADGALPGAGELGVVDYIEQTLAQHPELRAMFAQGVSTVETLARSRHPEGFTALAGEEKVSVLREIEQTEPGFFGTVFLYTYTGYYTHPRVVERLGLRPHPQPEGYELESGDLETLLQKVRKRPGKLYREC